MMNGKMIVGEDGCNLLYTKEGNLITMYQVDDILFSEELVGARLDVDFRADRNHRILGDNLFINGDI